MEEETPLDLGSQSLLGYIPSMVIKKIIDDNNDLSKNIPYHYYIKTVSLFADISGFTKLTESFNKYGRIGPEFLAFSLNRYMEKLINIISKNGGDIFKFAGDALLVIWPDGSTIEECSKRAIQCALEIQSLLHNVEITKDKKLSIKIGLGQGEVRILFVGGQFERAEYLIVGEAMRVACLSETKASCGGQTICHESVHNLVKGFYSYDEIPDEEGEDHYGTKGMKFYLIKDLIKERVQVRADAYLMRTKFNANKVRSKLKLLKSFVPKAISIYLDLEKERWSKEIRMLTIMFLNLKVDLSQTNDDDGIMRIQNIVRTVQRCIYMTKGALNKFLMDDKGSVMLIVWGLPPFSEVNDASRAVYTAMELVKELPKYKCGAYMGITTGSCFTGVCGTIGGRREYSLLGGVVNLSARHMQKAIEIGIKKGTSYEILLCKETKNNIQNDIACEWVCEGKCKGFDQDFQFYKPIFEIQTVYPNNREIFLPQLRTHKNNFYLGSTNEYEKKYEVPVSLSKSTFMVGRKIDLESFKKDLMNTYKYNFKELVLIRGVFGSGKTLFVRKAFYEFLEQNKELRNRYFAARSNSNLDFIFISNQNPRTYNIPFNGFNKIFKEILKNFILFDPQLAKMKEMKHKIGGDETIILCDFIGEILFESNCYYYQKYIEEILDINFSDHLAIVKNKNLYETTIKIIEIQEVDVYFKRRDFKNFQKGIAKFFLILIKRYIEILKFPLFFIIEDCQVIDNISVELISQINNDESMQSVCVICTLRDPICNNQKDDGVFEKVMDEFKTEKIYVMDNITDSQDVNNLIATNLSQKSLAVHSIEFELIEIILKKSYKGNPLFILDIVDSIMQENLALINDKKMLCATEALNIMNNNGDYCNFPVPIRIEKFVGSLLDSSSTKDLITLKLAAVIGNIFSTSLLHSLNEFNNLTFEDILQILYKFEQSGILDVLYDINIQHSVFIFKIPFSREVLYQRMLIEQKNDLHLTIARNMQNAKFSYMNQTQELAALKNHLKQSERTLMDYIKEEQISKNFININNVILREIKQNCHAIKRIDQHTSKKKNTMLSQCVKSGPIDKKSDKNISWESRYFAISKNKLFYWYEEKHMIDNVVPLGYIELKHLYQVEILPDFYFGNRQNLFQIHVAQWFKKDLLQGPRKYILSLQTTEELYEWVISLNFMRVKALHDEFTINFGVVSFPLFAVEKEEIKFEKNMKKKFQPINFEENKRKNHIGVSGIYNSIVRKSVAASSLTSVVSNSNSSTSRINASIQLKTNPTNSIIRRISATNRNNNNEEASDEMDKMMSIKKEFDLLIFYSIVNFYCYIQDIIFNIENTGEDDDMILIPSHIENFKYLPRANKDDPYILKILQKIEKDKKEKIQENIIEIKDKQTLGSIKEKEEKEEKDQETAREDTESNNEEEEPKKKEDEKKNSSFSILKNGTPQHVHTPTGHTDSRLNLSVPKSSITNLISIKNSNKNDVKDNLKYMNFEERNQLPDTPMGKFDNEEDEEKYDSKRDKKQNLGVLAVGKNLEDFDMSFDAGVNDIEKFFEKNHKKSHTKISFK